MPIPVRAARNSDEIRETLTNRTKLKALLGDTEKFVEWTKATAANMGDVTERANEIAERQLIEMIRNGSLGDAGTNRIPVGDADSSVRANRLRSFITGVNPNGYNQNAPGAVLDSHQEIGKLNLGAFFGDIARLENNSLDVAGRRRVNKYTEVRNALSESIPASGGFLVPEQMRADILSLALESAIVRPRATVMPMSSLELNVPTIDETSRATSIFGGITFGWADESEQLAVTDPQFGRVKLRAQKPYWYTHIPNELIDDAPALTVWLGKRLPGAFAFNEDRYFIRGNGVGQPLGVLNAGGRVLVDRGTNNEIAYEDVVNMFARMLPASLGRGVWIASNETIPQLFNMVKEVGTGGAPVFVLNASQDAPVSIFGRPIFYTEHASQLGVLGDLSFVDLSEYLIGDRMAMQVKTSEHYRFQHDQTALRVLSRVDGRPWLPQPITPENGGDTLSPYVILDA